MVYSLTDDDISMLIAKGIEEYKHQQEDEVMDTIHNSAKLLITNYRRFKRMKATSVYDVNTVTNITLNEILSRILGQVREGDFTITSIKHNKIVTAMLVNHIDVQLANYKKECMLAEDDVIMRRYRIVEMMYLRDKGVKADIAANIEGIDKSGVYRTLDRAYDDLSVYFFGVYGVGAIQLKHKYRNRLKK